MATIRSLWEMTATTRAGWAACSFFRHVNKSMRVFSYLTACSSLVRGLAQLGLNLPILLLVACYLAQGKMGSNTAQLNC